MQREKLSALSGLVGFRTYFLFTILFLVGCGRSPPHISEERETVGSLIHVLKSDAAASTFSFVPERRFLADLEEALEKETNPEVTKQLEQAITFIEESE